jgi:hypothetical protein
MGREQISGAAAPGTKLNANGHSPRGEVSRRRQASLALQTPSAPRASYVGRASFVKEMRGGFIQQFLDKQILNTLISK